MRVFQSSFKDRVTGATRTASKWTTEFRDVNGVVRRLSLFNDKAASVEAARKIERLVSLKSAGERPDKGLASWIRMTPKMIREKLVAWSILDPRTMAASKVLDMHVKDFHQALLAKGTSSKQAKLVCGRVQRTLDKSGTSYWSELSAERVLNHLGKLRDGDDGISAQTFNFYIRALKQFAKWMVRSGQASESPLESLETINVRVDRRHDRRALTEEEVLELLNAAATGPVWLGICGRDRAMLYRFALETGLRASEIASLTPKSFQLQGEPATVTILAKNTKNRRESTVPIRANLANEIQTYIVDKKAREKVFRLPKGQHTAKMLRGDLEAAGIPYVDESGRYADFHALRHTFITNLANAGVHPRTAQMLARHSTITLTMDRYSHSSLAGQAEALESLPSTAIQPVEEEHTDDCNDEFCLASCLASQGGNQGDSGALSASNEAQKDGGSNNPKPPCEDDLGVYSGPTNTMRRSGRVVDCGGFENRFTKFPSPSNTVLTNDPEMCLASCLAYLSQEHPDLANIVARWKVLPGHVRHAITTLVSCSDA